MARSSVDDMPDLVPDGDVGDRGRGGRCSPSGSPAAVSGAWTTVLLWVNRVPFSPDAAVVADPVFGRDIKLLPVRPAVPPVRPVAAQRAAAGRAAGRRCARYLAQATEGGEVFITRGPGAPGGDRRAVPPVGRVRLPAGQVRSSSYSTAGAAAGVGYTDANARFLAYDVLTFLSGVAGSAADRGRLHALAVAAGGRS